jgi:hypothetical protein
MCYQRMADQAALLCELKLHAAGHLAGGRYAE